MKKTSRKATAFLLAASLLTSSTVHHTNVEACFFGKKPTGILDNPNIDAQLNEAIAGKRDLTPALKIILHAKTTKEALSKQLTGLLFITGLSITINNFGTSVKNIGDILASVRRHIDRFIFKLTYKGLDVNKYDSRLERIEKRLRDELVGQDQAIDQIIQILRGYYEAIVIANRLGKTHEKGLLLYFTGSPGTGKSTAMKIIGEEMGLTPYVARMSDVVEDKGNNAASAAARLTKPVIQDNGRVKVSVDTPFTTLLKSGKPNLYEIDEIDKMRQLDAMLNKTDGKNAKGKIMGGSLDEMARNFTDTSHINGSNASSSVLIFSSNETIDDIKQLEDSLYNRYKDCIVQFVDLKASDYKEIIKRNTAPIQEFYKNTFGLDIEWDEAALDYFAERFVSENTGARSAEPLLSGARCALKAYREENVGDFTDDNLILSVDTSNNKIFVK